LCSLQAYPYTVCVLTYLVIPRPHTSMDHKYNPVHFLIQNSNSYSCTSQTFMLQGSRMDPTPVMPWGGSPAAGQPLTWPPQLLPVGYWPPLPPGGYWLPSLLAGHPGQSSSTPPPSPGQGYWSPSWAPPAGGQACNTPCL
jgi:hypothetical protein